MVHGFGHQRVALRPIPKIGHLHKLQVRRLARREPADARACETKVELTAAGRVAGTRVL